MSRDIKYVEGTINQDGYAAQVIDTYVREDGKVVVVLGIAGRPKSQFEVQLEEACSPVPDAARLDIKWKTKEAE